jgi:hypothetical protein
MGGMEIKKLIRPNETLSDSNKEIFLRDTLQLARAGFGPGVTEEDVKNHVLMTPTIVYLIEEEGKSIGFSSYREFEFGSENILYLDGIVVQPSQQGKGLFKKINDIQLGQEDYTLLATRTQSPVIYRALQKLDRMGKMYPNPETETPERIRNVLKYVGEEKLGMENISLENSVDRGTYGEGGMYAERPVHPTITPFFNEQLEIDYLAGDSVLIVGELGDRKPKSPSVVPQCLMY